MKELPTSVEPYKKTPIFTEKTTPEGLLKSHQTKEGTWGKIVICEGELRYHILEPSNETIDLTSKNFGVVEPCITHRVELVGHVSFYVEFYH